MKTNARTKFDDIVTGVLTVVVGPGDTIAFVQQKSGPYQGSWLLPGGSIELGESAEGAAIREVKEETGCAITKPKLFSVYELMGTWARGRYHLVMMAFRARTAARIAADFVGHNVLDARQVRPGVLPLHSTDLRILTDAGVASFTNREIETALASDGISMNGYCAT